MGVALFERVRGRLLLSTEGLRYLPRVTEALDLLETATLDLMAHRARGGALNLATPPTIGAKWLIPRLPAFQQAHPEVSINFAPSASGRDFSQPDLDCAIRYGEGPWPGAGADYLLGREVVAVAAPKLVASGQLSHPEEIRKQTLLHHTAAPSMWEQWCAHHGIAHPNPMSGPKLEQVASIARAAMAGLGIGLVPLCLVRDELESGMLVPAFGGILRLSAGYHLCYPESRSRMPALVAFRDWLVAQARETPTSLPQPPRRRGRKTAA